MASLDFESACGEEEERTPGRGACASSACAALVASFTDEKVELMAAGFASCTGEDAVKYADYADVELVRLHVDVLHVGPKR